VDLYEVAMTRMMMMFVALESTVRVYGSYCWVHTNDRMEHVGAESVMMEVSVIKKKRRRRTMEVSI
jgi:hypothetical protein